MNTRSLQGMGNLLLSVVLGLAAWALLVVVFSRPELRVLVDLTPGRTASVSDGTRSLIRSLRDREDVRVELHTFYRDMVPHPNPDALRKAIESIYGRSRRLTEELLRLYAALGGDKLRVVDNNRFSLEQARSNRSRLSLSSKQQHVVVVAAFWKDDKGKERVRRKVLSIASDLIEVDDPSRNPVPGAEKAVPRMTAFTGEAQISSAIKSLIAGGTPTVYFVAGHEEKTAQDPRNDYDYNGLARALQAAGFQKKVLNLRTEDIPADATVLACIEPRKGFDQAEVDKLQAYLKAGGRLFLNLIHHGYQNWNRPYQNLLGPLGLQCDPRLVAQAYEGFDAANAANLTLKNINVAHQITRPLFQEAGENLVLRMANARPLARTAELPEGVSVDPSLLLSDARCWLAGSSGAGLQPDLVPPNGTAQFRNYSVGALVEFEAAQVDGRRGKAVVISGQMFTDAYDRMLETGAQKDFALNCFDWLAERLELVPGRPGSGKLFTIDLGADVELRKARMRSIWRTLVLYVPGLFVILGVLVTLKRRRI